MKQQVDSATEKLLDLDSLNDETLQKVCNFEWWLSSTLDASTLTAVLDMIRHFFRNLSNQNRSHRFKGLDFLPRQKELLPSPCESFDAMTISTVHILDSYTSICTGVSTYIP